MRNHRRPAEANNVSHIRHDRVGLILQSALANGDVNHSRAGRAGQGEECSGMHGAKTACADMCVIKG